MFAILLLFLSHFAFSEPQIFKTSVSVGPSSFDPAHFYGTESTYIFHNVFRGLYRLDAQNGLVPEGAKNCIWQNSKKLLCELNKNFKWSDGSEVEAKHYVQAFQYLIDPKVKSREVAPLLSLKNAKKILDNKSQIKDLGIIAQSKNQLVFEFEEEDPEFLEKLASPILIPWKVKPNLAQADQIISNGPYKIKEFKVDQKIVLEPNPYYALGSKNRPQVEFLFLSEDSTSKNLFDSGKLDLMPRLETGLIPLYKNKNGFYQKVLSRFDYIGFGPELYKNLNLRKAIVHALNYEELSQILHAAGRPGCIGLSDSYITERACYDFDLKKAAKYLKEVPKELLNSSYTLKISKAGGDNIYKIAQWYQNQIKKNLNLKVNIEIVEQGMYLKSIKSNPPALFRKGINLDRPSCTSALENFKSQSDDNYTQFKSKDFDNDLIKLERLKNSEEKKKLCSQLIKLLMDAYVLIPQGQIHFSMLSSEKFKGWELNELNQLDLSRLEIKK